MSYDKHVRQLKLLRGYFQQKPSSIKLVKGVFSSNPGEVLCPTLSKRGWCRKHDRYFNPHRPKLLIKHHAKPSLELWSCKGCEDFLLRVERDA